MSVEHCPDFQVHELQIKQLTANVQELQNKYEKMEENQSALKTGHMKLELALESYNAKFLKLENGIDNITLEIRGVSEKLLLMRAKDEIKREQNAQIEGKTPDDINSKLLDTMVVGNGKVLYLVIAVLAIIAMFSIGMNVSDVLKVIAT